MNNRLADSEFQEQTHRWHLNSRARRRTWLQGLRPGDAVQLIPKAKYLAWVNIIKECRIELEYVAADTLEDGIMSNPPSNAEHYTGRLDPERKEIRLIVVQPGAFDDPIKWSWSTISVEDDTVNFSALSYCWGDPSDCVDLDVTQDSGQAKAFRVGRTVEAALRRLRKTDEPLRIWIDALCINQDDLPERSQQVSLMRDIYSRAQSVHIWLGEGDTAVDTCLRLIRNICNYTDRTCPGGSACACAGTAHTIELAAVDAQIQAKKEKGSSGSFHALGEIFDLSMESFSEDDYDWAGGRWSSNLTVLTTALFAKPWFTRVWVVQEAVMARRAFVHSSGEMAPWDEILRVNKWLQDPAYTNAHQHVQSQTLMAPVWEALQDKDLADDYSRGMSRTPSPAPRPNILEVFLNAHDLRSSDPKDKIFAMLTFGNETHKLGQLDDLIRPNYEKKTGQVFADFTRWWIKEHRSLAILSAIHSQWGRTWQKTASSAQDNDRELGRPTWAINGDGRSRWAKASLQAQFAFHATGDQVPDVTLLDNLDTLTLRLSGAQVSRITAFGYAPIEAIYPYGTEKEQRKDISTVFDRLLDPCGFTGLWGIKTIASEEQNTAPRARQEYGDHIRAHSGYLADAHVPAVLPGKSGEPMWYKTDKVPTCIERCFFVTEDGKYGLCPWMAREGDVIVLLSGGQVPYLLRPVEASSEGNETFEFVGECFVEGIMYGEYFQGNGQQQQKRRVFDLV